jgi:hypothetical protein
MPKYLYLDDKGSLHSIRMKAATLAAAAANTEPATGSVLPPNVFVRKNTRKYGIAARHIVATNSTAVGTGFYIKTIRIPILDPANVADATLQVGQTITYNAESYIIQKQVGEDSD